MGTSCEWRSVYWNEEKKVMLSIYVDDFKMAGPLKEVERAWVDLKAKIELDGIGAVDQYLGCKHCEHVAEVPADYDFAGPPLVGGDRPPKAKSGEPSKTVRYLEYDMEDVI